MHFQTGQNYESMPLRSFDYDAIAFCVATYIDSLVSSPSEREEGCSSAIAETPLMASMGAASLSLLFYSKSFLKIQVTLHRTRSSQLL